MPITTEELVGRLNTLAGLHRASLKKTEYRHNLLMDMAAPLTHILLAAGGSSSVMPEWNVESPVQSAISIIIWLAVAVLPPLYYLSWFAKKLKGNIAPLLKWAITLLKPADRKDAEEQSKISIRARLGTTLMHTSAQILTVLRLAVVAAILWHWWRLHSNDHDLVLTHSAKDFEPYLSWALGLAALLYFVAIDVSRRRAEEAQREIEREADDAPLSGPGGIWTRKLKDTFFCPAILDVIFLTFAGFCLPTVSSDLHLALIVPVLSAWLFRNAFRILLLWACILIFLCSNWYWSSYCECDNHWNTANGITPFHESRTEKPADSIYVSSLYGQTIPRAGFWLVASLLMIVMRAVRRETEDQAAFFQGLAEAMPFEVFVKDRKRCFVYANKKMLSKLQKVSGMTDLTLKTLQEKSDEDLNVESEKRKYYQEIDDALLNGSIKFYEKLEASYESGSQQQILTIKVPISASTGGTQDSKPQFLLGLCRDPLGDSDPYFYMAIVDLESPHCFFSKRDGKFVWVNEGFALDVGRSKPDEVINGDDIAFFTKECAEMYMRDDEEVIKKAATSNTPLVKEEWHQPLNKRRSRVHTVKMAAANSDGKTVGVRGYFKDIQAVFIRCMAVDLILTKFVEAIRENTNGKQIKLAAKDRLSAARKPIEAAKANDLIVRTIRLLNLRSYELSELSKKRPPDSPSSASDLMWKPTRATDPTDDMAMVCTLLELVYPSVRFRLDTWGKEPHPSIDFEWMKVALMGLGMTCAQRLIAANLPPDERIVVIKAGIHEGFFCISAEDNLRQSPFNTEPVDASLMKLLAPAACETIAAGLQIADRVCHLAGGSLVACESKDQLRRIMFKCRFPSADLN